MAEQSTNKSFYSLLEAVRNRPTLYLPRYSIFDFQAFYYGYNLARQEQGFPETDEDKEFSEFLEWIRKICPVKTNHSWANLLLFYSADEREALDKFFGLFDDFIENKLNSSEISQLSGTEDPKTPCGSRIIIEARSTLT